MLLLLLACTPDPVEGCDTSIDTDGDALSDCDEAELGTDPQLVDSDGDGFSDFDEAECASDPLDVTATCYDCGWTRKDTAHFGEEGTAVGDTIGDFPLVDQCGDEVPLHDLSGGWRIVFGTAAWCSVCLNEASSLDEHTTEFAAETGLDFSWIVLLFSSETGDPPTADTAPDYAQLIGDPSIPVVADLTQGFLYDTPYDGDELPGKCLLDPNMQIRMCWSGPGNDDEALDIVRAEGAAR